MFATYRLERTLSDGATLEDVAASFRSQRITHLLIDERLTFRNGVLDDGARVLLRQFLADRATLVDRAPAQALYRLRGVIP